MNNTESSRSTASGKDDSSKKVDPALSSPVTSTTRASLTTTAIATDTVYIGNIPLQYATEAILEKLLQRHGRLQRISVQQRKNAPATTAFAFGQFASAAQAAEAIKALNGRKLAGRTLVVRPAHNSSTQSGGVTATSAPSAISRQHQKRMVDAKIQAIEKKLKQKQTQGQEDA